MRNVPIINVILEPLGMPGVEIDVSSLVLGLKYEDCDHKSDKLTLTIDNEDLSNFDEPIWRFGNKLRVSWGYPEDMTIERKVEIKRVVGFRELRIECEGGELSLDKVTRTRTFSNKRRSEIARQIATEWGYTDPRVVFIQDTEPVFGTVTQGQMTDAQLLRELANKEGFKWFISHDGFHFHKEDLIQRTEKRFRYGGDPAVTEIIDINIDMDVTRLAASVQGAGYDPVKRMPLKIYEANYTDENKVILARHIEVAGIAREDVIVPRGKNPGGSHKIMLVKETNLASVEAAAKALLEKMLKASVEMTLIVVGDPNIYANTIVFVDGIGKRLSQKYYVRKVSHDLGSGGYTCRVECITDGSDGTLTKSKFLPEAAVASMQPKLIGKRGTTERVPIKIRGHLPAPAEGGMPQPDGRPTAAPLEPETPGDYPEELNGESIGMIKPPNIDLRNRPYHRNEDGSYSTLYSMHYLNTKDGFYYLVPTVAEDGSIMGFEQSIDYFESTGKHLGIYKVAPAPAEPDAGAKQAGEILHQDQVRFPPRNTLGPTPESPMQAGI